MRTVREFVIVAALASIPPAGCGGDLKIKVDSTPPDARLTATPTCGPAPLSVEFDASASVDSESRIIGYAWDYDGDGFDDSLTTEPVVTHTYAEIGTLYASVRVTNRDSLSASAVEEVWALSIEAGPSICLYRNRSQRTVRDIRYTLGLNRAGYSRGDTIRFFYQITNQRSREIEFPLHWTCRADFYVFSGICSTLTSSACRKKWRHTDNATCTPRLTKITLPPQENEQMTAAWLPRFSLDSGCYTAFGMLYHGPISSSDSTVVWVPFEVE